MMGSEWNMGKIIVQNETTLNPISLMGEEAGCCWGATNTNDRYANYKRGMDCIKSGHNRVMEYPQVYLVIDGYSARVIRELYTHIGGSPTRLQASTRYIDYGNLDFVIPPSIENNQDALEMYNDFMKDVSFYYKWFMNQNIPKEDVANILPLGMTTKVVLRTNLRNLVDMSRQRMCKRAYWEFRNLFNDIKDALSEISDEWKWIADNLFMPKCEVCGYCTEKYSCGRKPRREL